MTKTLFVLLTLFIFLPYLHSQNLKSNNFLKNELSLSYGAASVQELGEVFGSIFFSAIFFSAEDTKIDKTSGPVILKYNNYINRNVSVGLNMSYTKIHSSITYFWAADYPVHRTSKFYTFIASANYNYIPYNIVQLYSGIGLGLAFVKSTFENTSEPTTTENSTRVGYQLTPLGVRIGNRISGFAEFGFGYNGIINGGLSVKF